MVSEASEGKSTPPNKKKEVSIWQLQYFDSVRKSEESKLAKRVWRKLELDYTVGKLKSPTVVDHDDHGCSCCQIMH